MVTEIKKQNWFRKHWIASIFFGIIVLGIIGNLFESPTGYATRNLENQDDKQDSTDTTTPSCNPSWDCSAWSECSPSGSQTRTCTDSNNCGTRTGKPKTYQVCTYQYRIGDRVVVDDVAYTLNSKVETHAIGESYGYGDYESFIGVTAEGVFYIFDLIIENVGMESKTLWGSNIKIYDSQGRSFDQDSLAEMYLDGALQYDQLQPGLPKRGKIAFDVPKGLTGKLEISSTELFSGEKEYIYLGVINGIQM
ncbi:MAG: DUF4352 domain-containing protein [archaeon]